MPRTSLLVLLLALLAHAALGVSLNMKEMLRKNRDDPTMQRVASAMRDAARVLASDPAQQRRFLFEKDYSLVNELLSFITPSNPLVLEAGELDEVILPRASCEEYWFIEVCIQLNIFFVNPPSTPADTPYSATCTSVSIGSASMVPIDGGVVANAATLNTGPMESWFPDEAFWDIVKDTPFVFNLSSGEWVFNQQYLRAVRFQETHFMEVMLNQMTLSCSIPIKVVPSTADEEATVSSPTPTGTLFFDMTANLVTRTKYEAGDGLGRPSYRYPFTPDRTDIYPATFESGNVINYTWGFYAPESAEEDDSLSCATKGNITDITFSASNLGFVTISVTVPLPIIGGTEIRVVNRDLSTELPDSLNDPASDTRDTAVVPISNILCDLSSTLGDLLKNVITNLTWATDPEAYLQEVESLPVEEATLAEASLFPLRPGSDLVDIGDNLVVNLLGFFPDDSGYIGGADPENAVATDLLLSFADVGPVPPGDDPFLYIVDALFNTTLVRDLVPRNLIDVIEVVRNITNGGFLNDTDGILELGLVLEVQEGIPAVLFNVTIDKILVSYEPRADAPVRERFFLDQIRQIGPYTLQLPTFRFGDVTIELKNLDIRLEFFGGDRLLDPEVAPADRGVFEKLLEGLAPFVIPNTVPPRVTGTSRFDSLTVVWKDFFAEAAVMVPIDLIKFNLIELGPLLENIADCALSIFYETPRVAGARFNAEAMDVDAAFPEDMDGILILLHDFLISVLPMFQGAIPDILEDVINTTWTNQELFEPWVCPRAVNTSGREFYFNGTFWESASEFINEDLFFTLMDAIFPKGETPETAPYNQILAEPAELIRFTNVPSANGLNITVEFVLMRVELGGFSPGNFTTFELLNINETSPQFVETELDIGIPENPVFLHIDFELNTFPSRGFSPDGRRAMDAEAFWAEDDDAAAEGADVWWDDDASADGWLGRSLQFITPAPTPAPTPTSKPTAFPTKAPTLPQPTRSPTTSRPTRAPSKSPTRGLVTGQATNRVRLDVNFESVYVLIDLWLRFYAYDIESTRLNETTSFSCWMAKLQPFGGPSDIAARLGEQGLTLACEYCTTPLISQLTSRFNNPQATSEFFNFVNQILNYTSTALLNLFTEDEWEFNNANFQRTCDGLEALDRPSQLGEFSEDLGSVYVFMGFTTMVLAGIGFTTCYCVKAPHEQKRETVGAGALAGLGKKKKKGQDPFPDAGGPLDFLENVDNKEHIVHELERTPLYNHQSVPTWIKFFVPFLLLLNFILFIIGHVGQAVTTSIVASIGGIPIELRDFQAISVIKSAELLLSGGGYMLAILIIGLSIVWPYLKVLGMTLAWFLPHKFLGFHKRGVLIKRLDQMGKWSLIELYFLLFIIISFKVSVTSPENTFLPRGFYFLNLEITPQFSIYAFCTALVISLATSNLIGVYHEKIEKQMIHVLREPRKTDGFPVSVTDYMFPVADQTATLRMTTCAVVSVAGCCLLGILLLVISASMPALGAETVGLAGFVTKLEGRSSTVNYSLFTFFEIIYGGSSAGELYLGTFFMLTVLVLPLMQLIGILYMLLGRFTLAASINVYEVNQFLCSWACVEVFVVAVGVVILEVGQISGSIAGGACEFLREPMETYILPLGLVDEVDVQNTCFALLGTLLPGAYVMFFAIVFSNVAHYAVTLSFQKMVVARLDVPEISQKHAASTIAHGVANMLVKCKMLRRGEPQLAVSF